MGGEDRVQRFGRLVREHGEQAFRFAYHLTGSVEDAGDLVHEAFRRALERWGCYDSKRPLEAWFFAILRNLFLDGVRRCGRRPAFLSLDEPIGPEYGAGDWADVLADNAEPALESLERAEDVELVRREVEAMSVEHRTVLMLCDVEGMDYAGIARVLGCPVGTVRSRLSRARRDLRLRLENSPLYCGDAPCGDALRGDIPCGDMPRGDAPCGDMPCGGVPRGAEPAGALR